MPRRSSRIPQAVERRIAADCFNATWTLLEKPRRTADDDMRMIHMAHASRHHWAAVGTAENLAIGEWQISRVYVALGRAEPALFHARECLRVCRKGRVGGFPLAYAYEALARASVLAGRRADAARYVRLGEAAGGHIREKEDRNLFLKDLATVLGGR